MKRYTELTEQELAALTKEDIQRLTELECALEGIPIVYASDIPQRPGKSLMVPDVTGYVVDGIMFKNAKDAQQVAALANTVPRLEETYHGSWSGPRGIRPCSKTVEITAKAFYSEKNYLTHKPTLDAEEALQTEYDNKLDELKKKISDVEDVKIQVVEAHCSAVETIEFRERLRKAWAKYLGLAEGVESTAVNFMEYYGYPEDHINTARSLHEATEVELKEMLEEEEVSG